MGNNSKLNKKLILTIFLFVIWLNAKSYVEEMLHMNNQLSTAFGTSAAGTAAQFTFILVLGLCSFIGVYFMKVLWNNLLPRITSWKEIDYWEAMGITAFISLLTTL